MKKIYKFSEFIKEDHMQDPPEEYIKTALLKLQRKINGFFGPIPDGTPEPSNQKVPIGRALEKGKKKAKNGMSFKDLKVELESSELSKYSAVYDSITIKFSDPDGWYNLWITIPLDMAISKDKGKDFSDKDLENCVIKFKRYNQDNELIGQIGPKQVKIEDVNEELLVSLKIELDEEFGEEAEELELET